jgi:VanZ family protein
LEKQVEYLKQYRSSKGHGVVDVISDIARVEVAVETYL